MSTLWTPWTENPYQAQVGDGVFYVLRTEEVVQYGVQSISAQIAATYRGSPTCVDLSVTLGGKSLTLKGVSQDQNGTPGNWHK